MTEATRTLRSGFLHSVDRFPERLALEVAGEKLSYTELKRRAAALAATLERHVPAGDPALTAVFGYRSVTAFAGVLAALFRGHGYVPLNPTFPTDRTRKMLERAGTKAVIVDTTCAKQLAEVLDGVTEPLVLLFPELEDTSALAAQYPRHTVLGAKDLLPAEACTYPAAVPGQIAYLLFTSGSTGIPKGVMVSQANVMAFVDIMVERYGITEEDRFSQTFDMTFDLSAFDMFVCWERGACLCVPTTQQKALPATYINGSKLTIWFSVPSTGAMMNKLRMLKPGLYPTLRYSLFCGEALPMEIVQSWAKAAPNSILENLYGPTELTIACTLYRWNEATSPAECEQGVVPIGEAYPGMDVLVADDKFHEVPVGEAGELLMTGPQLSLGYWKDAERTAVAFITPPGKDRIYYRTGDRVRRQPPGKPLTYLGRIDFQIKIQGYRVELGEIEAAAREEAKVDVAIAVGWPLTSSGADGVVVFIGADEADTQAIMDRVKGRLPAYMVPSQIRCIREWPLNSNGKVDRKVLTQILKDEAAQA